MRPSVVMRGLATVGGVLAQAVIGLLFIAGGGYVAYSALQHEPHDNKVLYAGLGAALFGALVFPSIFPIAQRIYIVIFPNGLPFIGGKRASDPPVPPAPPKPPFDFKGPPDAAP